MKLRRLLALALTAALCFGGVITTHAAELDYEWYAAKNPDVVAEVGSSLEALQQHYEMYGRKEARMANENDVESKMRKLFNAKDYALLYPDVKEAYGDDAEAMFQHYISYGMLETRRPCDKVSYEAAVSLKNAIVKELEKAGLETTPGLAPTAAIIEGNISKTADSAATQQILTQVTARVEKVVVNTINEANKPPSKSSGNSSSSNITSSSGSEEDEGGTGSGGGGDDDDDSGTGSGGGGDDDDSGSGGGGDDDDSGTGGGDNDSNDTPQQ